jgi:hypothetical protein
MNPAQSPGAFDLVGPDRPGDEYLCVCDMASEVVVSGQVNDIDLRKFLLQLFRDPSWSVPEGEAVMDKDQEFHRRIGSLRFRHSPEVWEQSNGPQGEFLCAISKFFPLALPPFTIVS